MSTIALLKENQRLLNEILESEKDKEIKSNFIRHHYDEYTHNVENFENGCSLETLKKLYKNGKETIKVTKYINDKKFINITTVFSDGDYENEDQFINCTGDEFINEWDKLNNT